MKKPIFITLTIACFLIAVWFIGQATHLLEFYTISTTSNQPTYKPGDWVIASSLKKPATNSFIVFKRPNKGTWIFRCIAQEGDMFEVRGTEVYVNNKLLSQPFAWNEYYISNKQLGNIKKDIDKNQNPLKKLNDSTYVITLTKPELKLYHLNLKPRLMYVYAPNKNMYIIFKQLLFNEDYLGPLKVPKGCLFVLGDNRHDSFDSRYFGFVKAGDVISTVIN